MRIFHNTNRKNKKYTVFECVYGISLLHNKPLQIFTVSLVILKLDLELIATESSFALNNYLSDPNQHIQSLPKSTWRKNVNLPEHFQLICIISKGLLVCVFWNVKNLKINVMK